MMILSRRALLASAAALTALPALAQTAFAQTAGRPKPKFGDFGLDLDGMDTSIAPGDDFYRFMNGKWLRETKIPDDRASWAAQTGLVDQNAERMRELLTTASAGTTDSTRRKLADYYEAAVDEAAIERLGMAPLKPELDRIAAIATRQDLARALARLSTDLPGGSAPIGVDVVVDLKAPTRYVGELSQGGLGMPDRDYYLVDRPNYVSARTAYRAHVARMLTLAGLTDTAARADRVLALETRLATAHRTREDSRDANKSYNPRTPTAWAAEAPGLDWPAFLDAAGLGGRDRINIDQTEGVIGAAKAAAEVPIADWRDYLTLRALRTFAPVAPKAVFEENFDFQSRTLSGTPQPQVRWRRAIALTEASMGHATSQLYLDRYFPPQARAEAESMTANIKTAMGRHIRALPWMTPATKARALKKLANLNIEIGAEKTPRDFSALEIKPGDAWGNYQRAAAFNYQRRLKRIDQKVDRGEWGMLAQTVNASANYSLMKLMIPAGYLQPPLFDPGADPAVNYGGIGRTMGHELSHQFDDQGSKFDENGALNDWWRPQDLKQFEAAGAALAAQYDAYEVLPGLHINGRFTLGENIGDVAGLALAYDAWKISLNGKPAPVLAGYTGDQRFFMSHAQVWRIVAREAYLRRQITTDPHSPGEWRALQVRNLDPWYAAFKVTPERKLYLAPSQRVRVW